MESNSTYRKRARTDLENQWFDAALITVIYYFIYQGINWLVTAFMAEESGLIFNLVWSLCCFPLIWGFKTLFLDFIRGGQLQSSKLFSGYSDFIRIFIAYFAYIVIVIFGCLFFLVPGIIFAFMFAQTLFILKDDKEISAIGALKRSASMMKGHKLDLFFLYLSFIGWAILAILTLGIGFIFLVPYVNTTMAHFYEDLKAEEQR